MSSACFARICASAAALTVARAAVAQTMPGWPGSEASNAAVVETGLEPEIVLSAGYLRSLSRAGPGPQLAAGAGIKIAPLALGAHGTWRANGLFAADWRTRRGFGSAASAAVYLVHDVNDAGELHGFGLELRAAPGYRSARWLASLDLGWQGTLLTHFRHSDLASRTFGDRYSPGVDGVAGPRDGWYSSTAHRFRLGLRAAYDVNERVSFSLGLGSLVSYQRQGILFSFDLAQIPFYLESGLRLAW